MKRMIILDDTYSWLNIMNRKLGSSKLYINPLLKKNFSDFCYSTKENYDFMLLRVNDTNKLSKEDSLLNLKFNKISKKPIIFLTNGFNCIRNYSENNELKIKKYSLRNLKQEIEKEFL